MTHATELDLGPLTWVKSEIDQALTHASEALKKAKSAPDDSANIQFAQTHLHQACGALSIVGLDGLTQFTTVLDQLLTSLTHGQVPQREAALDISLRTIAVISNYLEELVNGAPDQPLRLYPLYAEMVKIRQNNAKVWVSPSDLFFPDLGKRPPRLLKKASQLPVQDTQEALHTARTLFEHGLLKWLKHSSSPIGAKEMREATISIAQLQHVSSQNTLWWVAQAFFDSLQQAVIPPNPEVNQICAALHRELRQYPGASQALPERLLRSLLYWIGQTTAVTERQKAVKKLWHLDALVPEPGSTIAEIPLASLLKSLNKELEEAKRSWDAFCSGDTSALHQFAASLKNLSSHSEPLGRPAFHRLIKGINSFMVWLCKDTRQFNNGIALEIASALLLCETALNHSIQESSFSSQVDEALERFNALIHGKNLDARDTSLAETNVRKTQEQSAQKQVAKEVLSNLAHIEQTLDDFFRNQTKRDPLATLDTPLKQIEGILTLIGDEDANILVNHASTVIAGLADGSVEPEQPVFEALAHQLSALGFYFEALQHGPANLERFLNPDKARQEEESEEASAEEAEETEEAEEIVLTDIIEEDEPPAVKLDSHDDAVSELTHDDIQLPPLSIAPEQPATPSDMEAQVVESVEEPLASAPVSATPPPGEEDDILDAELLEIFLEEAQEVLDTAAHELAASRQQPDLERLTSIRRGFHTLKGSGRMVGLSEYGEASWAVEQTLNRWLQMEWTPTPALFDLIQEAHDVLKDWAEQIASGASHSRDVSALLAHAERLCAPESSDAALQTPVEIVQESAVATTPETESDAAPADLPSFEEEELLEVIQPEETAVPDIPLPIETDRGEEDIIELVSLDEPVQPDEVAVPQTGQPVETEADAIEEILNLEEESPADAAQLPEFDMMSAPAVEFEDEIAALLELENLAEAQEQAETAEALPDAGDASTPPPVQAEPTPVSDSIYIGSAELSPALFRLFVTEAQQHLTILHEDFERLERNPTQLPSEQSHRSAHTLAGISGTAHIQPPYELARALEHALMRVRTSNTPPTPEQRALLTTTYRVLAAMFTEIEARTLPLSVPELCGQLETIYSKSSKPETLPESPAEKALPLDDSALEEEPVALEELPREAAPAVEISPVVEEFITLDNLPEEIEDIQPEAITLQGALLPESTVTIAEAPLPEAVKETPAHHEVLPRVEDIPSFIGSTSPQSEPSEQTEAQDDESGQASAVQDEIDEQLLPIFIEESAELVSQLHTSLRSWNSDGDSSTHSRTTARLLHTLKGSARMTGAMELGEFVHKLETRLETAGSAGMKVPELIEMLENSLDHAEEMIAALTTPLEAQAVTPKQAAVDAGFDVAPDAIASGTLRVRADLVDRFVNDAGEIGIARTRIEGELRTVRRSLLDLTENVIRLRNQLREVEIQAEVQMQSRIAQAESRHADFDPLEMDRFTRLQELTRMMAESVGDVTTVQQNLLKNLDTAELALQGQSRLTRELQQSLMQVRMVPFNSLADRLHRVVRQSAKDLGKRVNLDIRGGSIEMDRSVLEHMVAPLEHMIRNSIAHGIEAPELREAAGKNEIGQISLTISHEGNEISIVLSDDGAGLNYKMIEERSRARGLLRPDEVADERRLANLIFLPGFSTSDNLSIVSGRGVGMDVVRSETASVGGRVDIHSESGKGTEFLIRLPLTMAVTHALLVRAAQQTYAVPSSMITQVLEVYADTLEQLRTTGGMDWQGMHYQYHYLPHLLGDHQAQPEVQRFNWILLLRTGSQAIALHVDSLKGNQEIVVKHAGPQLVRIVGISGATVLGDGEIVLIINPVAMANRGIIQEEMSADLLPGGKQAPAIPVQPVVMIVDDSLTVRKITGRLLEREGYKVLTAKDGADALEKLIDPPFPDVILSDIEMPRMDGFDLLRNIRADDNTKAIPIIMITSRLADKHKELAEKLGANNYLGKPFVEEELLALLKEYTGLETEEMQD